MKVIAFFGIKGGTGKTTIAYHLAWMLAECGLRVTMADLDPQASLTALSLEEDRAHLLWQQAGSTTISAALNPLIDGRRANGKMAVGLPLTERLNLLPGDLGLFQYEDLLSDAWHRCIFEPGNERAFRQMNAVNCVIRHQAEDFRTDVVLIDLAPNLGALNRAALISADGIVFPLLPNRLSAFGLQSMGHALRDWRVTWSTITKRLESSLPFDPPVGGMRPIGYVLSQLSRFGNRPTEWNPQSADAIAKAYARYITGEEPPLPGGEDPNCLAWIKNYHSLAEMAYEAHKPMFLLRPADGVIGGHQSAAQDSYHAFRMLAEKVLRRMGRQIPTP